MLKNGFLTLVHEITNLLMIPIRLKTFPVPSPSLVHETTNTSTIITFYVFCNSLVIENRMVYVITGKFRDLKSVCFHNVYPFHATVVSLYPLKT